MTREERLAATFVELADSLVEDFDVVNLMVLLTERCVELLDAAAAGLLLTDLTGSLHLVAATSEAVEAVEIFQVQNEEGPCQDCFTTGRPVTTRDLAEDGDRWPRFAPVAAAAGFRAANALPMRLRGEVIGALNLFRVEPVALERNEVTTAQALADVATIALLQSRAVRDSRMVSEQLQEALTSRIAIEQAKGIVAQSLGIDLDQSFSRLRAFARSNGRRLTDVAQDVIDGKVEAAALAAVRRPARADRTGG